MTQINKINIRKPLFAFFILIFVLLNIAEAGKVKGNITDPNYFPLRDVPVRVGNYAWVAYSDSNGNFVTPNIPDGEYQIKIGLLGWSGYSNRINVTENDLDLGIVTISFGDLDENGSVNLEDAAAFYDRINEAVTNRNRYLDVNKNGILDSTEFEYLTYGVESEGWKLDEYLISKPDYVTYIPSSEYAQDGTNQHYLMTRIKNRLFGIWTQAYMEGSPNQHMVCHWSDDDGASWSNLVEIEGPSKDGRIASWGFPIYVPQFNRIYVFYNKDDGTRIYHTGELFAKYSEDGGETWSQAYNYKFKRGDYSPTDTTLPLSWWAYQAPVLIGGKPFVGFTEVQLRPPVIFYSCEIRFVSFDNILTEPDPAKLVINFFHGSKVGLRGSYFAGTMQSTLQEPSIVQLSNGKLVCIMRSGSGCPFYSVSEDTGHSWTEPQKLRYGDGRDYIKQPYASCPLYKIEDKRYLLVFHNNIGDANGGTNPGEGILNRTPAFVSIATENLTGVQPLSFSEPIRILENYVRPYGPQRRTEIATYPSLTNDGDHYTLWYPDRKHFLLGKILPKPIDLLIK